MKLPDDPTGSSKRRTLYLLLLLAFNAGTGHILTSQIVTKVNASGITLIKDDSAAIQEEGMLADEGAPLAPIENSDTASQNAEDYSIKTYTVKSGDTIGEIAESYAISVNTIRWANNLGAKDAIKPGNTLTILPISGILYEVKNGDTLSGIASKYDAHSQEILTYNELADAKSIRPGMKLIVPGGVMAEVSVKKETTKTTATKSSTKESSASVADTSSSSGFIHPIPGSIMTQGLHDKTAVDFGAPVGTTVKASAKGVVTLAKGGGDYNGGYGNYIIIKHPSGVQTLYAHLSSVNVDVGDTVDQGEMIGKSGNTGRSTGPHLHFEVRGATNPFSKSKVGTRF